MVEPNDVIDVEVLDETLDELPEQEVAPKKVTSDKRKQIIFWGSLSSTCARYALTLFLLGALGGLAFAIVYGEMKATFQLVLMIIAFSISFLGIVAGVVGFIARKIAIKYMKLDPNYEHQVE